MFREKMMAYGQWRYTLRLGDDEFEELLRTLETLQQHPERLPDFDVKFLASCQEQLTARRYLSEKQRALIVRIAEREAQASVGRARVREVLKVVERLPEQTLDQFYSIQAQADTPGRVLTEKQVLWLEKTLYIATQVPPPQPLAALLPALADTPDECVRALLAACLAETDLLGKSEGERLRELDKWVAEHGVFALYRNEVEDLVAAYEKVQGKLAGLSEAQQANRALRVEATEALPRLEARRTELTATERSLLRTCRATLDAGYQIGLQQSRGLVKVEIRLRQCQQAIELLEACEARRTDLSRKEQTALERCRGLLKRGRMLSIADMALLQAARGPAPA